VKCKKQKEHCNELLPYEKRFEVVKWVLFDTFVITGALIAAAEACQAVIYWRTYRNLAHSSIILAIIFGLCTVRDIVRLFF